MKIEHTPGPFDYRSHEGGRPYVTKRRHFQLGQSGGGKGIAIVFGDDNSNAELLSLATSAPHECSVPDCPGNLNRRKLEMWQEAVNLCDDLMDQGWTRINSHRAQMISEKAKELK